MLKLLFFILFFMIVPSNLVGEPTKSVSWSEFSLILKPSSLGGIGVFATHDIPTGTVILTHEHKIRKMKTKDIPADFVKFCIHINNEECIGPERFDRLEIGWFINHSITPNIAPRTQVHNANLAHGIKIDGFIAISDIKAGEEILIDYNSLDEPEHLKEDFYKNN